MRCTTPTHLAYLYADVAEGGSHSLLRNCPLCLQLLEVSEERSNLTPMIEMSAAA